MIRYPANVKHLGIAGGLDLFSKIKYRIGRKTLGNRDKEDGVIEINYAFNDLEIIFFSFLFPVFYKPFLFPPTQDVIFGFSSSSSSPRHRMCSITFTVV